MLGWYSAIDHSELLLAAIFRNPEHVFRLIA